MTRVTGTIQNNQSTTKLINQLKNSAIQYPPLNKAQELELIQKYRNDRDKLNELLYMHNVRLAFNMAKRYATKTNDFDALVSDCLFGLSVACQRFDIDKGIKFSTYATNWIFKYCLSGFYDKQNEIDKMSVSMNEPRTFSKMKSNNGNEVTFENYVNEYIEPTVQLGKTAEQQLSSNEMNSICKSLIDELNNDNTLSATDKSIFIENVCCKEKAKDLAEKYGKTLKDIAEIKSKVLSKFRELLSGKYSIDSFDQIYC